MVASGLSPVATFEAHFVSHNVSIIIEVMQKRRGVNAEARVPPSKDEVRST